jgi:hypothetical protein
VVAGGGVVDSQDRPITADDVQVGAMLSGFPEAQAAASSAPRS